MSAQPVIDLPLRDIRVPAEPSWWPPAPGWWLLAALTVSLLAWAGWRAWRAWQQAQHRHRILRQLDAELAGAATSIEQLRGAAEFLRRWALAHDEGVATLRGEAWLHFLDGSNPDCPFSKGVGRLLLEGPYRNEVDAATVQALLPLVRQRVGGAWT